MYVWRGKKKKRMTEKYFNVKRLVDDKWNIFLK